MRRLTAKILQIIVFYLIIQQFPEVVGSNPAPATKNLQLVGLAGELFLLSRPHVSLACKNDIVALSQVVVVQESLIAAVAATPSNRGGRSRRSALLCTVIVQDKAHSLPFARG